MMRSRRAAELSPGLPTSESFSKLDEKHHRSPRRLRTTRSRSNFCCSPKVLGYIVALTLASTLLSFLPHMYPLKPGWHRSVPQESRGRSKTIPIDRPPRVERSVLAKLASISDAADEDFNPSAHTQAKAGWPPIVTALPEDRSRVQPSPLPNPLSLLSPEELDRRTCGAEKCKFILPLRVGEQESKAREHIVQLRRLARRAGRTLVLPRVGRSRLGACAHFSFGTYYDVTAWTATGGNVVDWETFENWVNVRAETPSGRALGLYSKLPEGTAASNVDEDGTSVVHSAQSELVPLRCLTTKFPRLRMEEGRDVAIVPRHAYHQPRRGVFHWPGPSVVRALKGTLSTERASLEDLSRQHAGTEKLDVDPDVLVVDYDLRHSIFPPSLSSPASTMPGSVENEGTPIPVLDYAPALHTIASRLSRGLQVAVHWRMERVPPERLFGCARRLVDVLSNITTAQNISTSRIWLATDFMSSTFHSAGEPHTAALDALRAAGWNFTSLDAELSALLGEDVSRSEDDVRERSMSDDTWWTDTGVKGILDKLVMSRSEWFISGGRGCAKESSFTRQVIETRRRRKTLQELEASHCDSGKNGACDFVDHQTFPEALPPILHNIVAHFQ